MEKKSIKKYLLVIEFGEEETHLFNTIEELLKYCNCESIEEIIDCSNFLRSYSVYEISNMWCKNYG